jgi:glutathione S-transferase
MPVLTDAARSSTAAESTIVIEYLDLHYPGPVRLLPADPDLAWLTRMWDRFFDNYVHHPMHPMQKIAADRLRPPAQRFGVAEAREPLRGAYAAASHELGSKRWMMGEEFGLADCAAAPALFYANVVDEIAPGNDNLKPI